LTTDLRHLYQLGAQEVCESYIVIGVWDRANITCWLGMFCMGCQNDSQAERISTGTETACYRAKDFPLIGSIIKTSKLRSSWNYQYAGIMPTDKEFYPPVRDSLHRLHGIHNYDHNSVYTGLTQTEAGLIDQGPQPEKFF
jgi:hypothetical protein